MKVVVPGYQVAAAMSDRMVLEAYRFARFISAQVPHIDPYKIGKEVGCPTTPGPVMLKSGKKCLKLVS